MVSTRRALALVCCLVLSTLVRAQEGPVLEAPPDAVREAMQRGDWEGAGRELELLKEKEPDHVALWLLLQATARKHDQDLEGALDALAELEREESRWNFKSRFLRAEIYRELHRYEEATAIYAEAAQRLRSAERQAELAGIYMNFGDELSADPDPAKPTARGRDWERAYQLYAKVLELGAPDAMRERARFRMAACKEGQGQLEAARQAYVEYLAEFGRAETPEEWVERDEATEGRVIRARFAAAIPQGRPNGNVLARRELEDLAADLAAMQQTSTVDTARKDALHWEQGEALYRAAALYEPHESLLAVAALERLLEAVPSWNRGFRARFEIASRYRQAGRAEDALQAFDAFLQSLAAATSNQELREEEQRLRMKALYLRGEILRGQKRFQRAIETFNDYVARHSTGPDWAAAQQAIVACEYDLGSFLRADGQFEAARTTWARFLERHPLDARAPQILLDVGELFVEEAAPLDSQDESAVLLRAAIAAWRKVPAKYPNTDAASRALFRIGATYEELGELPEAIAAYRECRFGASQGECRLRLEAMTEETLSVLTRRTWRSDEPARIELTTRNIEEFELEIYALDLEAYFKKHLTHQRIEDLDLDLIAPDQRLQREVEGYQSYSLMQSTLELPVEGPGVWAVAITAGEKRATTLVLRSDIDILVKSSRNETFVFAQDMQANRPADGVRVLVGSPGSEEGILEAVTGEDGVCRLAFEETDGVDRMHVFALRDGHFASNGVSVQGLEPPQELRPRAWLTTDRSVYRPGQQLGWRAVVRDVENDRFTFVEGSEYRVEVLDSLGRPVHRVRLPLSEFGTLSGEVALDEFAPVGTYRVLCHRGTELVVASTFEVEEYQLQKVDLEFEFERDVYFRGEVVQGRLRASYYYGEPVTSSPVQLHLPDGRRLDLRTDAEGAASFTIETRDLSNAQQLAIHATLTEEGISRSGSVFVAVRGFEAALSTPRSVYLAGDSFPVELSTTSPSGEPVSRELSLTVLRLEEGRHGSSQVEVSRQSVTTDAESGQAMTSVRLAEGGNYVLRAEGRDRFKNLVAQQTAIFVSGDEDDVVLRFLSDALPLKVGETRELEVHNRAEAGLALVTFEGASILSYRLVDLKEGSNRIALEIGHEHFPNLVATVSMMRGNHFHTAELPFDVVRRLNVQVEPSQDTFEPGAEARVDLTVTDQLGRPVRSELSLSVVDAALFDLYPDRTANLARTFESGLRRDAALRTVSSCTFRYDGVTRTIAAAILAEKRRLEEERAWAQTREKTVEVLAGLATLDFDMEAGSEFFADSPFDDKAFNDLIGVGGGAGGAFGARFGGRKSRRSAGGRARDGGGAGAPSAFDADTAFWTPAVVTDAEGKASLTFTVPDRSTRWRVKAHGVGVDTLLGEVEASFVSRSSFFVELVNPIGLVEGDRPRFLARIHNLTGRQGECVVDLGFARADGEALRGSTARLQLGEEPVTEVLFDRTAALEATEGLTVRVEARFGDEAARDERTLGVRPYGVEFSDSASGLLSSRSVFDLELPEGRDFTDREVELHVGSGLDHLIVDTALGNGGLRIHGPQTQADAASDLIGTTSALAHLARSGRDRAPEAKTLFEHASAQAARLVTVQHQSGGWGWIGRAQTDSVETSCRAMVALAAARELGIVVPDQTIATGENYLRDAFQRAGQSADEEKAMIVHALSTHGSIDFAAANRLHRNRNSLSPAALAYTTLALAEAGRAPMAAEVAQLLAEKGEFEVLPSRQRSCRWPTSENSAWNRASVEMTALAVYALQRALPGSPNIDAGIASLLATRPWFPLRSRGLVVRALATFAGDTRPQREHQRITVLIGGERQELVVAPGGSGATVRVPIADDATSSVRVELAVEGRGTPHYQAVLRGFTADLEDLARRADPMRITDLHYASAPPRYRGRAIQTGFSTLTDFKATWRNDVEHLPRGQVARAQLYYNYHQAESFDDEVYLVLEVPLPAGVSLLEDTLAGHFESFDVQNGVLTVHVGRRKHSGLLSFEMLGSVPGDYHALPVRLMSAYDPGRVAYGEPLELTVLDSGETSPDAYRATPDELYHLGVARHDTGDAEGAHALLAKLFDEFGDHLRRDAMKDTANRLLLLEVDRGDSNAMVKYFEVLKEKDPSITIPFDKVLRVAEAYRELREFERAYLIFRATVEETFGKDLKVAGALEQQGELAGAFDTLERLCLEYPDFPSVLETNLALSDKVLTAARDAARQPSLRRAGRDRARLSLQGILMLRRFLARHPTSPLAPEAGLNLVSATLALEDYEAAAELGGEMAELYREPKFADAFLYTRAVAKWTLGEDAAAQELLQRIAEATYENEAGDEIPSENRELALYILGQIHHARREVERASEYYERVEDEFVDASEALAGFREKRVGLEEITTARPGEGVTLEVAYKNIEEAELLVYSVDLMTLYLREKSLSSITQVNLAGIAPILRKEVALGDGNDLRETKKEIELELSEPGAYLVICRGAERFASGLALVSDIELDVREEPDTGRMRVQVIERESGKYLSGVDVRVVGTGDQSFQSGRTDPRGLFVADGVSGLSTVIARLDDRQFAFHRGERLLGEAERQQRERAKPQRGEALDEQVEYFKNVQGLNRANLDLRQQNLDTEIRKGRDGVQVQQVK